MTTVSAAVSVMPWPPARVDSRNTKPSDPSAAGQWLHCSYWRPGRLLRPWWQSGQLAPLPPNSVDSNRHAHVHPSAVGQTQDQLPGTPLQLQALYMAQLLQGNTKTLVNADAI